MRIRIDHAEVWNEGKLRRFSILIQNETVEALIAPESALEISADQIIDANGCWVLPGGVDFHVHVSDGVETFNNGSCCAAAGGITTIMDMAPFHSCVNPQQFTNKVNVINKNSFVDVAIIAGIVVDQTDLTCLDELARMGAVYFKVFQPAEPAVSTETLWKAVQLAANTGLRLGIHAEDPAYFKPLHLSEGAYAFPLSRPAIAETSTVAIILEMAHATGAPIHICHVSTARSAELIAQAKVRGVDVTCEIPAHFLLLEENAFQQYGARVKTTPPLRSMPDIERLWKHISNGVIDILASDHYIENSSVVPTDPEYIREAASGIAGLEVSLPLLFNAVITGRISLARFVEISTENPAHYGNIDYCKGKIAPGMDADLTIWDPNERWRISELGSFSRIATTPYNEWHIAGRVMKTIVRGQIVWDGSTISMPAGCGRWIPSRR